MGPPGNGSKRWETRVARIDSFLRLVVEQRASDLHFHGGNTPSIRFDGELLPLPFRTLSDADAQRFLYEILDDGQRLRLEKDKEVDFLYAVEGLGRFRTNVFSQRQGLGAVFRVVRSEPPTLDDLLLPPILRRLTQLGNGLILVTGPTGAGKTTTLAALVHEINRTTSRHIITVEDPIEFLHAPLRSVVSQRQVGEHADSFASGLRAALRESPDVLVVGEMRDAETVQLALTAAETGVLVLATLHTNSAAKAIDRILDVVPGDSRDQMRTVLSVLLRCVVAQHLCRRASGDGRVAVMEILLHSWAVASMIRDNKTHQIDAYLETTNREETGMQCLDASIAHYVKNGYITLAEGLKVANYPDRVRKWVGDQVEE
jgi:twitching motility protein PilT